MACTGIALPGQTRYAGMMARVLIIYAHPQAQLSRVNRRMVEAAQTVPGVAVRDLYELYPDFHIHTKPEKQALTEAETVVLQHPFYWYSCPALMKEWIDVVLQKGWAYGEGGTALHGKRMMNALSTGGPEEAYAASGYNRFTIRQLLAPFDQTAHLCGMRYLPPLVFHDALRASDARIDAHAARYRALLEELASGAAEPLAAYG